MTLMYRTPCLLLITWRGRVWFVPLIFCFACVFLLALSFRVKARFVQSWHGRPEHAQPIVWTFSDEGLFVEAINSKHLYSWQAYVDALIAADKIILAQQGGQMFNFIPRRCFETDTDWQTVCQLVASKLPVRQTNR